MPAITRSAGGAVARIRGMSSDIDAISGIATKTFGTVWYVDVTNGVDTNAGKSPDNALKTLLQARTNSAAGDTIVIENGTYPVDVGTASLAPKADQTWMAARPTFGGAPNVIIVADADDHVNTPIAVDVDGVVFMGIEFRLVAGGTNALYCVDAAQTTAVRGLTFVDCWFNLNSVEAVVIACRFNDATNSITGMVMKNCRFVGGDASSNAAKYVVIGIGGIPSALIEDNIFEMESSAGDCRALDFLDPTTAAKSYGMTIRNNDFIGAKDGGGDSIGIIIASAAADNEVLGSIRTNYFPGCTAVAITLDQATESIVNNYVPDASGGALVDATT